MNRQMTRVLWGSLFVATVSFVCPTAEADPVTDCSVKSCEVVVAAKLKPASGIQVLAVVHTAVYEAVNAITKRYPAHLIEMESEPDASVDAAIAAASHSMLAKLVPSQKSAIDSAYALELASIADGDGKGAGIAVGEKAAAAVLALRQDDLALAVETYRPHTTAGVYIPTTIPVFSQWPMRKPWFMSKASQFRPDPPPALTSATWARDYNEIKAIGSTNSAVRTAEQTEIARFWETTLPSVYHGVIRSVAGQPEREIAQNARLFAMVTQAMDDAAIAVFDAKYHYGFWRPLTAIRNGDIDGNDVTERDSLWTPFIETPMHPEYPCAHCILAATVGTILQAEIGTGSMPTLTTTSASANGAARSWTSIDDFMQEVSNARIYDGVHYRNSTEVGTAMGKEIGKLAVAKYLGQSK